MISEVRGKTEVFLDISRGGRLNSNQPNCLPPVARACSNGHLMVLVYLLYLYQLVLILVKVHFWQTSMTSRASVIPLWTSASPPML